MVKKEEGYVEEKKATAEETLSAWSLDVLNGKLAGRELRCGPLSRIVAGRKQYYAYVAVKRPDTWSASLRRRLRNRV